MKVGKILFAFMLLSSATLLSACQTLSEFRLPGRSDNFQPLDSDIAVMAAPGPGTGDAMAPLYCSVGSGAAHVAKGWVDFRQTDFVLPAGGKTQVRLQTGSSGSMAIQGFFDTEGQKITFCPVIDAAPGERIACSSIYALEDDLQAGIKRTFDVPDAVRGGSISCAYSQDHLKKL